MRTRKFKSRQGVCMLTLAGTLFSASGLHAQERLSASETLTERTREFLSDPSRTGSLVGSIIAGAAVANPLAPILGSVAGFMIGKSSAFTDADSDSARRRAYLNRSLMPEDSTRLSSLSGLTGNPSEDAAPTVISGMFGQDTAEQRLERPEPLVIVKLPGESDAVTRPVPVEQAVIMGLRTQEEAGRIVNLPERTEHALTRGLTEDMEARINLQKQLAHACSNVELTQPPSPSCYYYSQ
ncbi:hypothetical protein ACUNV4_20000 [Granulosicoccus sp. 3-233]|uniref:hypothetical protein n=1 Tax=Granulosicoccus sp. 3-233 TaxID=3417969 RepID=UPI003D339FAF